jgi:hypothetical protein
MVRATRRASIGLIVLAAAALPARAGELTTARVARLGGQGSSCMATNVGKTTFPTVRLALVLNDTTEVGAHECIGIDANRSCSTSSDDLAGGAFCRITVKGSAKKLRANLAVYEIATHEIVAIEPAR